MENILGTVFFIIVLIWAYRVEINTAKTKESVERIEKQLATTKKAGK